MAVPGPAEAGKFGETSVSPILNKLYNLSQFLGETWPISALQHPHFYGLSAVPEFLDTRVWVYINQKIIAPP